MVAVAFQRKACRNEKGYMQCRHCAGKPTTLYSYVHWYDGSEKRKETRQWFCNLICLKAYNRKG